MSVETSLTDPQFDAWRWLRQASKPMKTKAGSDKDKAEMSSCCANYLTSMPAGLGEQPENGLFRDTMKRTTDHAALLTAL